ncbi:uncharacterized protein [Amphiura filiformis]|uniref:uncharacterized protein n=1 Tax=Amphiura filiformis TaxID=82378 RepID=UPI003B2150E5
MELYHIFVIITKICLVQSTLHRNLRSETYEQRCGATCKECFADQESLKRMGCLETCIAEGVDHFTCPESKSFLSDVGTLSPVMQRDIEEFFARRSDMFTVKDVEGIVATFTEQNSIVLIDHQKPIFGRADRAQQVKDFFMANPELDHVYFDPANFGEEYGIIWVNGIITEYDKEGQHVWRRFMTLLKRINGELRDYTTVIFQY